MTNEAWEVKGDGGDLEHLSLRTFRYDDVLRVSIAVAVLLEPSGTGPARRMAVGAAREPYRALVKSACDVTVVGGAARRLAIFRRGEVVVDAVAPSAGGMAPLAPSSPLRAGLLHGEARRHYEDMPPQLDAEFPWSYFQSAPADLRVGFLEGHEGVLLEGIEGGLPDVRTRLPGLCARSVLVDGGERRAVSLHLDTVAIDVARGTLLVVHRGVAVLRGAPSDALVVARVGTGEEPTLPLHSAAFRAESSAKSPPLRPGLHSPATLLVSAPLVSPDAGAPFQVAAPVGTRRPTPRDGLPFQPVVAASPVWAAGAWSPPVAPVPVFSAAPGSHGSTPTSPTLASAPDETDEGAGPLTPPSPAARVAAELRELGLAEAEVRRVMRSFRDEG